MSLRTYLLALLGPALVACSEGTSAPVIADRLAFAVVPSGATAGEPFSPAVQVVALRPDGSVATDASGEVTVAPLGAAAGVLSGTATVSLTSGRAVFADVRALRVSTGLTLVARMPGVTGAESSAIPVGPGAPVRLEFVTQPDSAVAGAALVPMRVRALDVGGNVATTTRGAVTIRIATGPTGATTDGVITADLTQGEAVLANVVLPRAGGGYTLEASLVGATGVASAVTRTFGVRAGPAAALRFATEPSTSVVGVPMVPAVQVGVVDANGNPVTGATPSITMTVALGSTGLALTGTTTSSAVGGIATFDNLRPDRASTTTRLRASATGLQPAISGVFSVGAASLRVEP